jgi:hypothetical protein
LEVLLGYLVWDTRTLDVGQELGDRARVRGVDRLCHVSRKFTAASNSVAIHVLSEGRRGHSGWAYSAKSGVHKGPAVKIETLWLREAMTALWLLCHAAAPTVESTEPTFPVSNEFHFF